MAKKQHSPLFGHEITFVARKGNEEKVKDVVYEKALEYKKQFEAQGWSVSLYQKGYYQPFNINKIPRV